MKIRDDEVRTFTVLFFVTLLCLCVLAACVNTQDPVDCGKWRARHAALLVAIDVQRKLPISSESARLARDMAVNAMLITAAILQGRLVGCPVPKAVIVMTPEQAERVIKQWAAE